MGSEGGMRGKGEGVIAREGEGGDRVGRGRKGSARQLRDRIARGRVLSGGRISGDLRMT